MKINTSLSPLSQKRGELTIIEFQSAELQKNGHQILKEINLSLHRNEIHSPITRNSAKKSTLAYSFLELPIHIIFTKKIRWMRKNITKKSINERAKTSLTLVCKESARFKKLIMGEFLGIDSKANHKNLSIKKYLQYVRLARKHYVNRPLNEIHEREKPNDRLFHQIWVTR